MSLRKKSLFIWETAGKVRMLKAPILYRMHYNEQYDLDGFEVTSFTGEDFVASHEIMDAIQNLPDEQKEVIMLYYFEDLSVKEIASDLNISENTVKSRLKYAREKLKDGLGS